eukprot:367554_1
MPFRVQIHLLGEDSAMVGRRGGGVDDELSVHPNLDVFDVVLDEEHGLIVGRIDGRREVKDIAAAGQVWCGKVVLPECLVPNLFIRLGPQERLPPLAVTEFGD